MPGVAVLVSTRIGLLRRHVVTASTHQCFPWAGTTASCQRSTAGEEISGELAAALYLSESTVSHHLSQLRKAGLVISDRRGDERVSSGAPECVAGVVRGVGN